MNPGQKSKNGREEDMKFISWNVNGIRACAQKGFMDIFNEADADIFCIQESKMQAGQLELDTPGYHQYWNYAERKGYSGTNLHDWITECDGKMRFLHILRN